MICEPWVVRVWWEDGGARLYYYRTKGEAKHDAEHIMMWGNVASIEGPTHNIHIAGARERTILRRAILEIEQENEPVSV